MTDSPDIPTAIVIGAGSGGLTVAIGLSRFGRRTILVESGAVGGDCTNVGCIPSKSLLHHSATADGRSASSILDAVRARRDDLRDHETIEVGETDGIDLRVGRARILGPGRVQLTRPDGTTEELEAPHVVIATGSRPRVLPIEGLSGDRLLTNENLFELTDAPRHLAIVGAGAVGLEMAVAFCRLGSEVTVLDAAPRILPVVLSEASEVLARSLTARGISLRPSLVATSYDEAAETLQIGPLGEAPTEKLTGVDRVLVAVGRTPNSENLGLDELGVELDDASRIVIDDRGATSVPGVWATGDVSTEGATTHAANAWGRRIIKHLLAETTAGRAARVVRPGPRPIVPAAVFTDPEVATIGVQPETPPDDVRRIVWDSSSSDRAYTDEVDDAIIVVDVRRVSGRVLGATIVGPRAGELISVFSLAMKNDLPLHKWYGTIWPYPSYAEALNAVVDEYMAAIVPNLTSDVGSYAKGLLRRLRNRRG